MKYTVEMGSGAIIYTFHKYWFERSKADGGGIHT
jgi:hypothetical protein